ncbi:MAG: polysaccharide biosynthesis/export family protein [Gallionella sp.]|nr:polysaccharide biosynthesis/export family protein [Gallionella sp.]
MFELRRCLQMLLVLFGLMLGLWASVTNAADLSDRAESAAIDSKGYRLGTGDVINISVYGEDDLSRQNYRLPDSGLITFPFGEVRALGLSLIELESRIADGLRGGYLINPRVSVSMEAYRPFFINGQVSTPGAYPYQPGMSVRKAVALAGGLKERASESKIFLIKETDSEHKQTKISMDGPVFPGDTITVEESFF